jgi:hypothetical protein
MNDAARQSTPPQPEATVGLGSLYGQARCSRRLAHGYPSSDNPGTAASFEAWHPPTQLATRWRLATNHQVIGRSSDRIPFSWSTLTDLRREIRGSQSHVAANAHIDLARLAGGRFTPDCPAESKRTFVERGDRVGNAGIDHAHAKTEQAMP